MQKKTGANLILCQVITLALLLRSLVPVGFMLTPAQTTAGVEVRVTICTGNGPQVLVTHADELSTNQPANHDTDGTSGHALDSTCPFATALALGALLSPPNDYSPAEFATLNNPARSSQLLYIGRSELPHPARGPPPFQA